MPGVKNIFGGGSINPGWDHGDVDTLEKALKILEKYGVDTIDTATLYGESEAILGKVKAAERFTIDTKTPGGFAKADRDTLLAHSKQSQEKLGTTVDVWYLHAPDPSVPIEETVAAVNEVYKTGFFKRFGLSNFVAADVQKVYDIAKSKGWVLPTVYQGNYNAVARKQETELFPTLRKLGISFYAYSPIAGGFLSKTKQDIIDGKGRFDTSNFLGQLYAGLYSRPSYLEALNEWNEIAADEGIPKAELAYRWVEYHSGLKAELGDAVIIGARTNEQIEQTLAGLSKGPLSDKSAKRIDALWELIKHEAPLDNYNDAQELMNSLKASGADPLKK